MFNYRIWLLNGLYLFNFYFSEYTKYLYSLKYNYKENLKHIKNFNEVYKIKNVGIQYFVTNLDFYLGCILKIIKIKKTICFL